MIFVKAVYFFFIYVLLSAAVLTLIIHYTSQNKSCQPAYIITASAFFVENVPPEHFQGIHISSLEQGEAVLSASPRKSCRFFSPHSPCAERMAQGISPSADGDQGRCPWTLPAFFCKKLLDRKKFLLMKSKCCCPEQFIRTQCRRQ